MTYVKTYLPTLKTHVVNLKRDANDLSRDLQQLEVRGKLGSKTLYCVFVDGCGFTFTLDGQKSWWGATGSGGRTSKCAANENET